MNQFERLRLLAGICVILGLFNGLLVPLFSGVERIGIGFISLNFIAVGFIIRYFTGRMVEDEERLKEELRNA